MVGFEPTEYGIQGPGSYHLTTSECNSRYGRSRTFLTYTILLTKLFATKLCFRVYTKSYLASCASCRWRSHLLPSYRKNEKETSKPFLSLTLAYWLGTLRLFLFGCHQFSPLDFLCSSSNRLRLIELLSSDRISHFKSVSFCVTEVTA